MYSPGLPLISLLWPSRKEIKYGWPMIFTESFTTDKDCVIKVLIHKKIKNVKGEKTI